MGFNGDINSDFHGIYMMGIMSLYVNHMWSFFCALNVRYFDCPTGDMWVIFFGPGKQLGLVVVREQCKM